MQLPLSKLSKHFKNSGIINSSSKIESNDNSFTVLTERILEVITDSTTSYTFLIETPTSPLATFENFVIVKDISNNYNLFIYRYTENESNDKFTYDIYKQPITTDQIDLGEFEDYTQSKMTLQGNDGCTYTLEYLPECTDYETAEIDCWWDWVVTDVDCPRGGGGSTPETETETGNETPDNLPDNNLPNPFDPHDYNSPVGGSGGINNAPFGVIEMENWRKISNCINSPLETGMEDVTTLSPDKIFWMQTQPNKRLLRTINSYLQENGCSEDAQEFTIAAFEALMDNDGDGQPDGEVDWDEQIINNLEGKALCIYNQLKSSSSGFKNAIQNFDGEFPVSHISFKINNSLSSGNYGITNPPSNFNITVEFSNNQLNNISDLGGAVAFAHEIIHAEIFRKMLSAAKTGDLDPANMTREQQIAYVNSLRDNFEGIYDYYIERYKPTWNHNQMASHYRGTIADILEEFDNSNKPRQIYDDISWVGLRELENGVTSIAWDNLSQSEKDRVLSNFTTYFFNGTSNCN